ncbi:hypothetical protein VNI00_019173 [Paramarasmius palmivorus]|uniref:Fe2OG dioxygenase domain-containing protein n=1 Tax=Paramarasmius palmivorus TaxID=297713 RepID=A0AAW0ARI9_9AGAR
MIWARKPIKRPASNYAAFAFAKAQLLASNLRAMRFRSFDLKAALQSENACRAEKESVGDYLDEELVLEHEISLESSGPHVLKVSESSAQAEPGSSPPHLTARQRRNRRKTELKRERRREGARQRDEHVEIAGYALACAQEARPYSLDDFDAASLPISNPGWVGKGDLPKEDLSSIKNLRLFNWKGRDTVAFLDRKDRLWALLGAPPPRAKDWEEVNDGLVEAFQKYDQSSTFSKEDMQNRRSGGEYGLRDEGISFAGGKTRPGNIAVRGIKNRAALKAFSENRYLGRVLGHTGRLYCTFANKLARESRRVFGELQDKFPEIRLPSHPSIGGNYWAARCLNSAGRAKSARVITKAHADYGNWAPNWCCVTAVGKFDPDKGGHLVFWNVGLAIRFPPGCSVLFPSALVTHSNMPIQPGETRYSIVQYSPGGLFRWVYNGHMTDEDFFSSASEEDLRRWSEDKAGRWKDGLRLFTKWQELLKGDYKGEELGDLSELSELEEDLERPAKRRRK